MNIKHNMIAICFITDDGKELIECVGETSTYPTVQTSSIVKASTEGLSTASSSNLGKKIK